MRRNFCGRHWGKVKSLKKHWREVRDGDILVAPSGLMRIARKVEGSDTVPSKRFVHFTIQRCSWTRRDWTTYSLGELAVSGYRILGRRAPTDDEFGLLFSEDLELVERGKTREESSPDKQNFKCCMVRGIP